ncbi:MAG: Hpt domain-containing protein [Opitutae bacterium]|nr:Hpt domain-containing protein [Opitutae bacterium]
MANDPVLDPQALDNLRAISPDDGGEFLRELVAIFLSDTPERIAELETAIKAGDQQTGGRAAHSIKGSASNFGAGALAAVAKRIEQLCKEGQLAAVGPLLRSLHDEYARVDQELRAVAGVSGP